MRDQLLPSAYNGGVWNKWVIMTNNIWKSRGKRNKLLRMMNNILKSRGKVCRLMNNRKEDEYSGVFRDN
eukprot:scaffold58385_cov96-Attheya_sp.AAC.1